MCAISGFVGNDAEKKVSSMLESMSHRGPDASSVQTTGIMALGNAQLYITGCTPQPIGGRGVLTYNGEIYNFAELAREIGLSADSDSLVLFKLIEHFLEESGSPREAVIRAARKLDGDYAFAYAAGGEIVLARDIVGVKPLYYSGDSGTFAFASEKKALWKIGLKDIRPLPPANILHYDQQKRNIAIEQFHARKKIGLATDIEPLVNNIGHCLTDAVCKRLYKKTGIAFSGGLDSSIIAEIANKNKGDFEIILLSVGITGSHDLTHAKKAAELLGMEDSLHIREFTIDEITSVVPEVIRAVESPDPMKVSIGLPLYLVCREAKKLGIRVVMTGQGADELFAGYKRYENIMSEGCTGCASEFERSAILAAELEKDLRNIASVNLERDDAVAMANSVELRVPFLDEGVINTAREIDPALKIFLKENQNGSRVVIRKYILRRFAETILPEELARKEKKAVQYSSGMQSALEAIAKKNGYKGKNLLRDYISDSFNFTF